MKVRRRRRCDGITGETRETSTFTELDRPMTGRDGERLKAALEAYRVKSFERRLTELEAYCCRVVKCSPSKIERYLLTLPHRSPRDGSSAYYAREILHTIHNVRGLRGHLGPVDPEYLDLYSRATAHLATLATEWQAREWPATRSGVRTRARAVVATRAAAAARSAAATEIDRELVAMVQAYRRDHRNGSARALAAWCARRLERTARELKRPELVRTVPTIRRRLASLKLA